MGALWRRHAPQVRPLSVGRWDGLAARVKPEVHALRPGQALELHDPPAAGFGRRTKARGLGLHGGNEHILVRLNGWLVVREL